jgi:hypothetical protein
MSSKSCAALKMAAVFVLVMFAGQLLMAAPAAANKCTIGHSRTGLDDCSRCLRVCDIDSQMAKDKTQYFKDCFARRCKDIEIAAADDECTIDHSRTGTDDCSGCLRVCDIESQMAKDKAQYFKDCFAERCKDKRAAA